MLGTSRCIEEIDFIKSTEFSVFCCIKVINCVNLMFEHSKSELTMIFQFSGYSSKKSSITRDGNYTTHC